LRVEHLYEPLGIDVRRPRLSWWLPANASRQRAYQIRANEWDSGRVESDQSVLVSYAGPPLESSQHVVWQVKVWTDAGESNWSEKSSWEMGLLDETDWLAQWIEPVETEEARAQASHPAHLMRGSFSLSAPPARARAYVTAHGIYELFINGTRVGDLELTPGFTSYWANLHVQTFDVTELLHRGDNVVGAVVSDGWFRGQTSGLRLAHVYGDTVALLAQLHVYDEQGSVVRVGTGPDWITATGSIRSADLFEGQTTDFHCELEGWCRVGPPPGTWSAVSLRDYDMKRLRASPAPPVRRVEELHPVAITQPREGRQVIDLGQNINGWVRLTNLGGGSTILTMTHGEALDGDGDVSLANLSTPADLLENYPYDPSNLQAPLQVDVVTATGAAGESFEPRHTTHGFRYVRVEGYSGGLSTSDVTGIVVHTDFRRTGWFECSDQRINRLHDAAVWSFRGNACDVPTDCPTRERAGWTGDWQIFAPVAAFLYDVAGFSTKWLRDLAADQRPDGRVTHFVPNTMPVDVANEPFPIGSAGWGDAAVIVPWEMYRAYGDLQLLEEQWPSMTAWIDYAARTAREQRHPSRVSARAVPEPHESFLWDAGFHFGEWLEPGDGELIESDAGAFMEALFVADHSDVATAYLAYSARLLGEIAQLLGREGDAERYRQLAAATRDAWQKEFIGPDGALARDTQAAYVRALAFDLAPKESRAQLARRLVELIREAGTHLGTGFLATPYLLPVLADSGHLDVAYELLFQKSQPSWLTMIDRGATTIWEGWNGIDDKGIAHLSLNHYSKGAVVSFLHRHVAGIQMVEGEPAYRRFRIAPTPGGGISSARAKHDSPYGRIESSWKVEADQFLLDVIVPPGTSAEVCLPDGQRFEAQPGNAHYRGTLQPDD